VVRAGLVTDVLAAVLGLLALGASPAFGATLPSGFQDEPVLTGLEEPTSVRFSSDGRIFVAEKAGKVLVFDSLSDKTPQVFADLRTNVYDTGDRGILGFALDPDFPSQPYVYLLYTYDHILGDPAPPPKWGTKDTTGDPCPDLKGSDACVVSGRLVRLTANGDQAIESSGAPLEHVLVEDWCQQFSSHSIGDLQFGPEGALYASGGDGASFSATDIGQLGTPPNPCGDPSKEGGALRAQDVRTSGDPTGLDGTIIRIDPETGKGWPGNPLSGPDDNARRIIGFGFRNPFRFGIDPDTDELYVGNVGWDNWEEIERFSAAPSDAFNGGWPCYEGPAVQLNYKNAGVALCKSLYEFGGASLPFFSYPHREGLTPGDPCLDFRGSAVAGFAFYGTGPYPPQYDDTMFFTDSVRGCIYAMFPGADGRPDPSTVTSFMHHSDPYSGVDLEIGPDGNLYYVSFFTEEGGSEFEPGAVHRIQYFPANEPPVARLSADKTWGDAPLTVEFDASESEDADGDDLEFEWDLDGDGDFGDAPTSETMPTETYGGDDNRIVAVRVVDPDGAESTARLTIYPDNTPPEPVILSPSPGDAWSVGEEIEFEGSVSDEEDDSLPLTSFDWVMRLFHCPQAACHAHPLHVFPSVASGSFLAPDHDLPTHIELTLTAVDSRGLAAQQSVDIDPRTVDLTIASNPPGVSLTAGPRTEPAPFGLRVISGAEVVLSAPESTLLGGVAYPWLSWSDGGARFHSFTADHSGQYLADYIGSSGSALPPSGRTKSAPRVRIHRHPPKKAPSSKATFAFSATQPVAGFHCRLDRRPVRPCKSPKTYKKLLPGQHTFKVFPVDANGKAAGKATVFSWRVLDD
jgi:glucose/arabinose dehydrogenase